MKIYLHDIREMHDETIKGAKPDSNYFKKHNKQYWVEKWMRGSVGFLDHKTIWGKRMVPRWLLLFIPNVNSVWLKSFNMANVQP